jgi:arabinogalactan endo-1,4-beta-galactosidase
MPYFLGKQICSFHILPKSKKKKKPRKNLNHNEKSFKMYSYTSYTLKEKKILWEISQLLII